MVKIPENPFILVDGSSYLFRAFHALPPLTTTKGQPTGAMYGVFNMLRRLIKDYHPERIAVVFDSKEKNIRHQKYPAYKANRITMPDDLQQQIEPLYTLIRAMGLPLVLIPGIEADDIIASLATEAKKLGWFTLISTGDKDFAQIVDDKIYLINTMSQVIYDRARVIEKFEVAPESIVDYLALIGDSVDNIPGVSKVGPKTAVKWLQTYGSLDNIIAHAAEIPGKVGENLREAIPQLPLFKELVTIDLKLKLEYHPNDFILKKADTPELKKLFSEYEFKTWLKDLETSPAESQERTQKIATISVAPKLDVTKLLKAWGTETYETIFTQAQFEDWLKRLEQAPFFSFDTETTSLDYMAAELVGLSFAVNPGEAAYLPLAHDYMGAPEQLSRDQVLQSLKPLFEDSQHLKLGHNLKYDKGVLANYGITLKGLGFDTMLESYVLNSAGSRHDMNTIAEKHLLLAPISYEEVAGKGVKQLTFNQIPIDKAAEYAAEDADATFRLHQSLWPKFTDQIGLIRIFQEIEMPLITVLSRMERQGVLVDAKMLNQQSEELKIKLEHIETEAFTLAGKAFNINSPKQLQEVLFEELKLPVLEKTPTGQPSTAESVLQELAEQFPLPKVILEYRSLSKLKSTYTDKLPLQINAKTGRIHTSFHQAVTSTGRLSSTDPNLQNIPIRSVEGRKIRSAFIAPRGYKIVAADYSQIELRILAHMSQDANLLKAFNKDDDIHRSTASEVFGVPLEKVTAEQRRSVKAINFGLIYGMSSFGLSKQLNISRGEAEVYIKKYFECFPSIKGFSDSILAKAKTTGFVETLFGRRLYLPDLLSNNRIRQKAAERAAVNAPMQGTNADIIKLAMIELDRYFQADNIPGRMIIQVHDELVFELSEKVLDTVIPKLRQIMENVVDLSVKLKVGIGLGDNWEAAHSL